MKLIFVYNAKSGTVDALLGGLHKIVSPSTYNCNLCVITFGNLSENKIWKAFREKSDVEMDFYHKDEFSKKFRSKWLPKFDFPLVLSEEKGELVVFIPSEEINALESPAELIDVITKRLSDR